MSIVLTDQEKATYNTYLRITRSKQNKPYRLRKDFEDMDDKKCIQIHKLTKFFEGNKIVKQEWFFEAPFEIFKTGNFDLSFYLSRKALSCYSSYVLKKRLSDPESDETINAMKSSFRFIVEFCREHKISIDTYSKYVKAGDSTPVIIHHLARNDISFYCLHALDVIPTLEKQFLEFIIPNFYDIFQKTKIRYISSKNLKENTKKIVEKLKKYTLIFQENPLY